MVALADVQKFFEEQKAAPEVVQYLEGIKKSAITPEAITSFIDTDDGKKLLQPRLDQYFTKGLETWKAKTFPTLMEEEIKKRFPDETEEQKKLRKLEEDLAAERKLRVRASLQAAALSHLTSKGMPVDLVDFCIADDEDSTKARLATIEKIWTSQVEALVEKRFKDGGVNPNRSNPNPPDLDAEIQKAEQAKDYAKAIYLKNEKARLAAEK